MRVSIIYGEDSAKAYNKYREIIDGSKKKQFEIVSITDIHNITSQTLFEDKIVFTLDRPNKIKLNDWKWFHENSPKYNSNLLIYYPGNAPATVINNLPKDAKKEKFELPKIIFLFLDSFYPGNAQQSLKLFNDLVAQQPIELVFHLLSRHLRDLAWVSFGKETLSLPSWRLEKLSRQAGKFGPQNLRRIISELAEIDIKSKTSDVNLKNLLDILIMKQLE